MIQLKSHHKTWLYPSLGVLAFVAVCVFSPVRVLFDPTFLITTFKHLGGYGPFLFVLTSTITISLGVPGNVLAVAAGAVFGFWWGFVWAILGATLGAIGAFLIARFLIYDWASQRFAHHRLLKRLNQTIADYPYRILLAVRFTPLSPFSLVNFLFGLTPVDLKTYTIGTALGLVPLYLAYSWLGVTGNSALQGGDRIPLMLALGGLTLLTLLPLIKPPAAPVFPSASRILTSGVRR